MSNYRVIDIRGRFAPADGSWGTQPKDLGVVLHYAGLDVAEGWWDSPLAYIKHITQLHSQRGRFAANWTFSGSAYAEYVFGNTVYRVMNWRAWTPHAGNLAYNKRSIAIHVPIGLNQLPKQVADGTMTTALRRADDHLRAMGKPRSALKGHLEVGSSACPGDAIMASIRNYRAGAQINVGAPKSDKPAPPAATKTIYRVQLGAFSQRGGADTLERKVKQAGFDAFVTRSGGYYKVQSGAFGVRDNAEDRARALGRKGFGTFIDAGKKA